MTTCAFDLDGDGKLCGKAGAATLYRPAAPPLDLCALHARVAEKAIRNQPFSFEGCFVIPAPVPFRKLDPTPGPITYADSWTEAAEQCRANRDGGRRDHRAGHGPRGGRGARDGCGGLCRHWTGRVGVGDAGQAMTPAIRPRSMARKLTADEWCQLCPWVEAPRVPPSQAFHAAFPLGGQWLRLAGNVLAAVVLVACGVAFLEMVT